MREIQSSDPGLNLTSNPVLRSRAEPSPIWEEIPDPGLGSNLDLRSRSEFALDPVLRSRSEFDIESSPQVQGRAESDSGGKPRSRTEVKSGSQIQV